MKGVVPRKTKLDGKGLTIAIIHTRWNKEIVDALVDGAVQALIENGVEEPNILVKDVPGAYELPAAVKRWREQNKSIDAFIPIGVLIKGSTMHFEYIADAVSHGLMKFNVDECYPPVIFGVLTCLTEGQARVRAGIETPGKGTAHNHGTDWGLAAIEMAQFYDE